MEGLWGGRGRVGEGGGIQTELLARWIEERRKVSKLLNERVNKTLVFCLGEAEQQF